MYIWIKFPLTNCDSSNAAEALPDAAIAPAATAAAVLRPVAFGPFAGLLGGKVKRKEQDRKMDGEDSDEEGRRKED